MKITVIQNLLFYITLYGIKIFKPYSIFMMNKRNSRNYPLINKAKRNKKVVKILNLKD